MVIGKIALIHLDNRIIFDCICYIFYVFIGDFLLWLDLEKFYKIFN